MKKLTLLVIMALVLGGLQSVFGQTYTNSTPTPIPDADILGVYSDIIVSGISPLAELSTVTINIAHTYDGDLDIYLVDPLNNEHLLSSGNGGNGVNYTNTNFSMTAGTNITAGTAPFNGYYSPEQALPIGGVNPNGTWRLLVIDWVSGDVGTITNWSVTFVAPTCPTIGIHTSPTTGVTTMTCRDSIYLVPNDSSVAGGAIYPTLYFQFYAHANGATSNAVYIYEDGVLIYSAPYGTMDANTQLTVYFVGAGASPSSNYTINVCNSGGASPMEWVIYDGNGTTYASGNTPSGCTTYPTTGAWHPAGLATWTIAPSASGLYYSDNGWAGFWGDESGVGTYTLTYHWNNQGTGAYLCSGTASTTITVTNPWNAAWTSPGTVCATSGSLNLNSYITGNTGGIWSGTGVTGNTFNPTGLSGPINITYYVGNSAACNASVVHAITVTPAPTVSVAGSAQSVCGTTATLAGNTPTNGTGTWTLISGSGTITAPSSATSGITGLGVGANVFQWTIANSPCTSSSSQVTITGVASPTVSVAGTAQSVCGTTATLAGNIASIGTGTWTVISGSGNITTPSSPTSGITGLGVGANVFQWTIANSPCTPSTSQVTITGVATPTVSVAGSNQSACSSSATLAGNTPTAGTGLWTLVSGSGTITSPNAPNSGVTGLANGANVFQWTISNPPCSPSSSQVTITNTGGPTTSVAGVNQSVCATTATLNGNIPTVGTGLWTLVSGSGIITTPTSPNSGVTGLGTGANIFQWTISNPPCTPSTSQVTITGVANPTVSNAGIAQSVCSTTATLAGNTPTSGTGLWTLVSGSGTITSPSSPNSGVTGLGNGANVFEWTISNSPCTSSSSQVTITNTGGPTTSVAGVNQSVCSTTATLNGNTPTVGTGLWTLISGSGNITSPSSPNSGVTGLGTGANVFQWAITNAPCPPSTSQVTITGVANPTVAAAGSNQSVCSTTATLAGNTPTTGTGLWTLVSGNGTITSPTSPNSGVTGLGNGANVFQWTITNSPCPSSSATVTINSESGVAQIANQTNVLCYGGATGSITVSMTGGDPPYIYTWQHDVTNHTSTASNLIAGTYNVTISTSGICSDTLIIIITQPSIINASIAPQDISCHGLNDGILIATATGGTPPFTYMWNTLPVQYSANANGLSQGTYTVTIKDSNNCTTTFSNSISEPDIISISDSTINPTCFGGNTGAVYTTVTGGTQPYTYAWTGNITTPNLSNASEGDYTLIVTDVNNCTDTLNSSLNSPSAIIITDTTTVSANNTGNINISVTGGLLPYTYIWSNGDSTQNIVDLANGVYIVTVTDLNSCINLDTITIDIPELPIEIPTVFTPNGDGKNDDFEITHIEGYTDISIEIYNRWGDKLFLFKGTGLGYTNKSNRWDGKNNGKDLPMGSYVFIIKLGRDKEPINGVVSIIR